MHLDVNQLQKENSSKRIEIVKFQTSSILKVQEGDILRFIIWWEHHSFASLFLSSSLGPIPCPKIRSLQQG